MVRAGSTYQRWGDREWVRSAKGGQAQKASGWDGGGALDGAAAGAAVGTFVLGSGGGVALAAQLSCAMNARISA